MKINCDAIELLLESRIHINEKDKIGKTGFDYGMLYF
jgi:hypothetical protein